MDELRARVQGRLVLVRARVQQVRDQTVRSIRFTRAILSASRTILIGVGLIDPSEKNRVRYIPFQLFWVGWWLLFAIGLILPTYRAEAFVVFPSVLALAIVWLLGMGQFAHTLLGEELRFIRVSPAGWTVFISEFQKAGLDVPSELLTAKAAATASKELQISLPGLVRQSIVDFTSLAAVQALLAGAVAVIGLILGSTLGDIHWWRGWSPVSIFYAASLPTGLSLVISSTLPFMVARLLAALRLQDEIAAPAVGSPAPAVTPVSSHASVEAAKPKRRAARHVLATKGSGPSVTEAKDDGRIP
jgi:hypothetical protein